MSNINSRLLETVQGGLIVSCQPLPNSAMDTTATIVAMARAAVDGGASALRIEGFENVAAVAARVNVPIVGIVKRDLDDYRVRITPFFEDIERLARAGARIIAFDATNRRRPVAVEALLDAVRAQGCMAMADCSNADDGARAWALGCELIGTTLSGYTSETNSESEEPDFDLIGTLSRSGCRVVAEGRFRTPAQAAKAMRYGAFTVTIGSAITRIEHTTAWFSRAIKGGGA